MAQCSLARKGGIRPRFQRIFGRLSRLHRGGTSGLLVGNRNTGFHRFAEHGMRDRRSAPHLRPREPARSHGPQLDHGQDRADLSRCGRLRSGAERDLRSRRPRPQRRHGPASLGAAQAAQESASRRLAEGLRPAPGRPEENVRRGPRGSEKGRRLDDPRGVSGRPERYQLPVAGRRRRGVRRHHPRRRRPNAQGPGPRRLAQQFSQCAPDPRGGIRSGAACAHFTRGEVREVHGGLGCHCAGSQQRVADHHQPDR